MNETTCTRPVTMDRKDLAIGKIIRLLPLLPVKELDAMGDRLRQRLHSGAQPIDGENAATDLPKPSAPSRVVPAGEPAGAAVDLA